MGKTKGINLQLVQKLHLGYHVVVPKIFLMEK